MITLRLPGSTDAVAVSARDLEKAPDSILTFAATLDGGYIPIKHPDCTHLELEVGRFRAIAFFSKSCFHS